MSDPIYFARLQLNFVTVVDPDRSEAGSIPSDELRALVEAFDERDSPREQLAHERERKRVALETAQEYADRWEDSQAELAAALQERDEAQRGLVERQCSIECLAPSPRTWRIVATWLYGPTRADHLYPPPKGPGDE